MRRNGLFALVIAAAPLTAETQGFQIAPTAQPEVRVGVVTTRESMLLAGIAVNVPAGYYVRVASSLDVGRTLGATAGPAARAEVVARFLADPFHQSRWGLYGGGGLAFVWREGERRQGALVLVAGVEPPGRGWTPAVEIAGGAGLRLSLAFKPVRRVGR